MIKLTSNEQAILRAGRDSEYDNFTENPTWVFSVIEGSGLDAKVARGVISSLVKKGLVEVFDNEGNGRADDMCIVTTDAGTAAVATLDAGEMPKEKIMQAEAISIAVGGHVAYKDLTWETPTQILYKGKIYDVTRYGTLIDIYTVEPDAIEMEVETPTDYDFAQDHEMERLCKSAEALHNLGMTVEDILATIERKLR